MVNQKAKDDRAKKRRTMENKKLCLGSMQGLSYL